MFVKFYTKWCGYCRIMAPEYDKLALAMKEKRKDIIIARIEGSENQNIAFRYGVFSFPTIMLFSPRQDTPLSSYRYRRVAVAMEKWLEEFAPKSAEEKTNSEEPSVHTLTEEEATKEIDYFKNEITEMKSKLSFLANEINQMTSASDKSKSSDTTQLVTESLDFSTIIGLIVILSLITAFILVLKIILRPSISSHKKEHIKI